jgi:hypothetical protein
MLSKWLLTSIDYVALQLFYFRATMHYWTMQAAMPHIGQHLAQANETLNTARLAASAIEARSSLTTPWTPDSLQRREALVLCQRQDYHQVLDELEQRAISRQLELEKIGLPKTGENYVIQITFCLIHSCRL